MRLKTILVFILCLFIGSSTIIVAKMSNGRHLYVSPRVLDDYRVTIEGELLEMENLRKAIDENRAELEELEALKVANEDVGKEVEAKLFQDLAFYNTVGGFTDVMGPGVEIIIDDSTKDLGPWDNPNDLLVHDLDLLLVINELKESGAEIISVNGQRIVDTSSITCSGYTVRINGRFYGKPFRINAIGDGSRMSAALIGPGGYGTVLKEWGLIFKVTIVDQIKIPAYINDRSYKYMTLHVADKAKEGVKN